MNFLNSFVLFPLAAHVGGGTQWQQPNNTFENLQKAFSFLLDWFYTKQFYVSSFKVSFLNAITFGVLVYLLYYAIKRLVD